MNRIRRIAMQLLERYDGMFSTDFESNKELLDKIAVFRSKELRNEVAGYITRHIMRKASAQTTTMDEKDEEEVSSSSRSTENEGVEKANTVADDDTA
ncbi:hypothetical protein HRbin04_00151 [archaeon HR04]|nr:hypothetical protein HRbin04_00151 [archaeon HR04]